MTPDTIRKDAAALALGHVHGSRSYPLGDDPRLLDELEAAALAHGLVVFQPERGVYVMTRRAPR